MDAGGSKFFFFGNGVGPRTHPFLSNGSGVLLGQYARDLRDLVLGMKEAALLSQDAADFGDYLWRVSFVIVVEFVLFVGFPVRRRQHS